MIPSGSSSKYFFMDRGMESKGTSRWHLSDNIARIAHLHKCISDRGELLHTVNKES